MQVNAEKLAWDLAKKHKLDLVTIHPSLVMGTVYSPDLAGSFSVEAMKVRQITYKAKLHLQIYSQRLCLLGILAGSLSAERREGEQGPLNNIQGTGGQDAWWLTTAGLKSIEGQAQASKSGLEACPALPANVV